MPKDPQFCLLFAEIASKRLTVGDANKPKRNRVGLGMGVALTLALRSRALAEKLRDRTFVALHNRLIFQPNTVTVCCDSLAVS